MRQGAETSFGGLGTWIDNYSRNRLFPVRCCLSTQRDLSSNAIQGRRRVTCYHDPPTTKWYHCFHEGLLVLRSLFRLSPYLCFGFHLSYPLSLMLMLMLLVSPTEKVTFVRLTNPSSLSSATRGEMNCERIGSGDASSSWRSYR
jgi:hypothetical protein